MKKILIIGACSAIAAACARRWVSSESEFVLTGRDADKLQQQADDLLSRGAKAVHCHVVDVNELSTHQPLVDFAIEHLRQLDLVLMAYGSLPDQARCETDVAYALQEFHTNAVSTISLLGLLGARLEQQAHGALAVIASVAADRGRPSNYLYGSAKAAVATYAEGLRARLFKVGVSVTTIKPGFVDTPMTQGLDLPALLLATPDQVARRIVKSVAARRAVVYAPAFWWPIMLIIRCLPQVVFKRLNL
ncbi:SDR family oxidoreductase [Halopseudomonas salegens]|uniref:Short-subunit dehydrogenase n=1 Tax=Halopseudomonas salegens TaxID=1434072 RepID=A0A1H2EGC5_9GAMM|nr:SDR family oxidoreductase [Halopseudomonas salegens]SDT94141.1 hypothetical protein SAMN05216210_0695 [Halopseudomonas salegens]